MTFDLWWVSEVGHPPADERERYAFEMARKTWVLMPTEFRQKLTAIQQMLTIADTQEKRLELSDRLIRLGREVEPEMPPEMPRETWQEASEELAKTLMDPMSPRAIEEDLEAFAECLLREVRAIVTKATTS